MAKKSQLVIDKDFFKKNKKFSNDPGLLIFILKLKLVLLENNNKVSFDKLFDSVTEKEYQVTAWINRLVKAKRIYYENGFIKFKDESVEVKQVDLKKRERQQRYRDKKRGIVTVKLASLSPVYEIEEEEEIIPLKPNDYSYEVLETIKYFNLCCDTKYRLIPSNSELIIRILKLGYSMDDVMGVIAKKSRQWKDNPKMCKYLRLKTIFGVRNFENYLNEIIIHSSVDEFMEEI